MRWFRLAADQGHLEAQYNLGLRYARGEGVLQDQVEAARWYRLAAEQGHTVAKALLESSDATGVPAVARRYQRAAEQGDASAQLNLGDMYAGGVGVPQDDTEAVKWYRLAAEQGDAGTQYNLGVGYSLGVGVLKDDAEAARWFRLAADQGDAGAQSNLGFMYREGRGVPQDDAEAVRWFRLAVEQGNATAQYNLGFMYDSGRGVPQDGAEAVRWLRLAADQGNADAQNYLEGIAARSEWIGMWKFTGPVTEDERYTDTKRMFFIRSECNGSKTINNFSFRILSITDSVNVRARVIHPRLATETANDFYAGDQADWSGQLTSDGLLLRMNPIRPGTRLFNGRIVKETAGRLQIIKRGSSYMANYTYHLSSRADSFDCAATQTYTGPTVRW